MAAMGKVRKGLFSFLQAIEHQRMRLASILLAVFVVLGVSVATIIPPFHTPDEATHWLLVSTRFSQLTSGGAPCVAFTSLYEKFWTTTPPGVPNAPLASGVFAGVAGQKSVCVTKRSMYGSLLTYPGAVLALALFAAHKESPADSLRVFYLARILQGLMVTLVLGRFAWLAHKNQCPGALSLIGFMFGGLALQEAFGVTADGILFAFAVSLCSVMVAWERLTLVDVALFGFLGLGACTTKPFLMPAIIPSLFAGFVCARSKSASGGVLAAVWGFVRLAVPRRPVRLASAMLWIGVGLCIASVVASYMDFGSLPSRVSAEDQRKFLIANPRVLLVELPLSISKEIDRLSAYMGPMAALEAPMGKDTVATWRHLLWAVVALELALIVPRATRRFTRMLPAKAEGAFPASPRGGPGLAGVLAFVVVAVSAVLCLYATILSLYLTWTHTASRTLGGFQSRYAIPNLMILIGVSYAYLSALFPPRPGFETAALSRAVQRMAHRWVPVLFGAVIIVLSLSLLSRLYFDVAVRFY